MYKIYWLFNIIMVQVTRRRQARRAAYAAAAARACAAPSAAAARSAPPATTCTTGIPSAGTTSGRYELYDQPRFANAKKNVATCNVDTLFSQLAHVGSSLQLN